MGGLLALALASTGCASVPSPVWPGVHGSIGMTHRGVLVGGEELPITGDGFHFLRHNDRHWALPRFADAVERAAAKVEEERPGSSLVLGDFSTRTGGRLLPHFSHRAGRDGDLVFYLTTLDGAPVSDHGFLHVGADGLAWDEAQKRYLRFDIEREWLLVKALLEDPEGRVQWIFIHHDLKALMLRWAEARGEPTEIVWRASQVMLQPNPGGLHDDHIHVRTTCSEEDVEDGCEPFGPVRPWLALPPAPPPADPVDDLVTALLAPIRADAQTVASSHH